MATKTKTVRAEQQIAVCDRCGKVENDKDKKAVNALPLTVTYGPAVSIENPGGPTVLTPVDFVVCTKCKDIIENSIVKTARPRKPKAENVTAATV